MFVGWEGVGLCSYLLIGFWYTDLANVDAGRKAFIVNRIGDFALPASACSRCSRSSARCSSRSSRELSRDASGVDRRRRAGPCAVADFAALCLFVGAIGQERPDPALRLAARRDGRPDAGLGPHPRRHDGHRRRLHGRAAELPVQPRAGRAGHRRGRRRAPPRSSRRPSPSPRTTSRRCSPTRPCRSSASCSSACGVGAFGAALFHVVTHAFFKALLFLGAGAVIHAMHDEQDIRKMGGLAKDLPVTCRPSSSARWRSPASRRSPGFFSKDEILAQRPARPATAALAGGLSRSRCSPRR